MESVRKPLGYLLCALGLILLVQFIAFPFYARDDLDLALTVWSYINIGTAVGSLIAVVVSYLRWREYDRTDLRQAVAAGGMFMFSGAFTIMFFEHSLSALWLLGDGESAPAWREPIWIAIDVSFPVLMGWVGSYLLRSE